MSDLEPDLPDFSHILGIAKPKKRPNVEKLSGESAEPTTDASTSTVCMPVTNKRTRITVRTVSTDLPITPTPPVRSRNIRRSLRIKSKPRTSLRMQAVVDDSVVHAGPLPTADIVDLTAPKVLVQPVVGTIDLSADSSNDSTDVQPIVPADSPAKKIIGPRIKDCPICLDPLLDEMANTCCGHVFHHKCIMEALGKSKLCPICRARLTARRIYRIYI